MKYIFVEQEKLNGCGEVRQLTEGVLNFEVNEEIYEDYKNNPLKYIFKDGQIVLNPDYEKEVKELERKKLDSLSLTAADVERAIYKVKGMDFEDVVEYITTYSSNPDATKPAIDIKALKIELKANNFYRGNPYISQIGALLGFSEAQLDEFFTTGDYRALESKEDEIDEDEIPF